MEKGGIILFEQIQGDNNLGSSRIRGHWLVKNWDEKKTDKSLEIFVQGAKYDFLIFQKAYWTDYAKRFTGVKILDICDPDWLGSRPIMEMINNVDGITASSEALVNVLRNLTDKPVMFIPDRQDLEFHPYIKKHEGDAKWVCWFGYTHNNRCLDPVLPSLDKLGLKLKVISDARPPYVHAEMNVKYEWNKPEFDFNKEVTDCDIVIMPPPMNAVGQYKSLNKTYTAWALGMPVANCMGDLKRFISAEERTKEAELRIKEVREKYDIKLSVVELNDFINQLKKSKDDSQTKD